MPFTKMRPINDRLVIRHLDAEEMTSGGLAIPDTAKEKPLEAVVVAVGPGRLNENTGQRMPLDIKEGEHVLISKYAGSEFSLNNETLVLIEENDVLAVLS